MLVCCIRLQYDWSFHLFFRITYTIQLRIIDFRYYNYCEFFTPTLDGGLLLDSERQEVSLSILVGFNEAVNVIVSSLLLFFNLFSSLFSKSLRFVPSIPTTIDITITLMFHSSFLDLWQGSSICLCFRFLLFLLRGSLERRNPLDAKFFRSWKSTLSPVF